MKVWLEKDNAPLIYTDIKSTENFSIQLGTKALADVSQNTSKKSSNAAQMTMFHAVGSKQTPTTQRSLCCVQYTYLFRKVILIFKNVYKQKNKIDTTSNVEPSHIATRIENIATDQS